MGGTEGVGVAKSSVLRSRFADRVRALLGEAGLSSKELAARCKLPLKRIDSILEGRLIRITMRDMTVIAGVLGTPLYCLLVPVEPVAVVPFEIVEERGSRYA